MGFDETEALQNAEDLTPLSDGWTDDSGNTVVNYVLSFRNEAFFYSSENFGTRQHTSANIAQGLIKVIERIRPHRISTVCTDNAPAMRRSWLDMKEKYKHIICLGCGARVTNLLTRDIFNLPRFKQVTKDAEKISSWWRNHLGAASIFKEAQRAFDAESANAQAV